MSTASSHESDTGRAVAASASGVHAGRVRTIGLITLIAGVVLAVAGAFTYVMVSITLADENITVSDDAKYFAGDEVNGPLSAASEAQTIEKHALAASGGKTYAELPKDDPNRQTVMTGSFLRASLFTSVVAFGVAAMAVGIGIIFALLGWALMGVAKSMAASAYAAP
jgi:hypothetical protein